jgi:hypothetical protein
MYFETVRVASEDADRREPQKIFLQHTEATLSALSAKLISNGWKFRFNTPKAGNTFKTLDEYVSLLAWDEAFEFVQAEFRSLSWPGGEKLVHQFRSEGLYRFPRREGISDYFYFRPDSGVAKVDFEYGTAILYQSNKVESQSPGRTVYHRPASRTLYVPRSFDRLGISDSTQPIHFDLKSHLVSHSGYLPRFLDLIVDGNQVSCEQYKNIDDSTSRQLCEIYGLQFKSIAGLDKD